MAYGVIKTNHAGPKRGNGAHWGTKLEAKSGSRKLRRSDARTSIRHELDSTLSEYTIRNKGISLQRRTAVLRPEGYCAIRVSHRAARKRGTGYICPRYLLRCGDCNHAVKIYYDADVLEINGVHGSIGNWREILLPLLGN